MLNELVCIDCGSKLSECKDDSGRLIALACGNCEAVYPVEEDDIRIMLTAKDAFHVREEQYLERNHDFLVAHKLLDRFQARLKISIAHSMDKSWEKEDVEYWDNKYNKRAIIAANRMMKNSTFST